MYPGQEGNNSCYFYGGQALYPSRIFPNHPYPYDQAGVDRLEAILQGADAAGVHVFVGVGNFAWFDYSEEALCWSMRVARELNDLYGHHASFYGWYMSAEMAGNFDHGSAFDRS